MTVDIERALVRRAIRAAGGYARLAAGLGISRQTIYLWKRVPEHWIIEIERVSGTPRHELRPDLYREPLTVDIERMRPRRTFGSRRDTRSVARQRVEAFGATSGADALTGRRGDSAALLFLLGHVSAAKVRDDMF